MTGPTSSSSNEDLVTANDKGWTGFYPDLNGYCKCYYTSPHKTG